MSEPYWAISFPFALRFLFASRLEALARALTVIYRLLATHLAHEGWRRQMASLSTPA